MAVESAVVSKLLARGLKPNESSESTVALQEVDTVLNWV